ncbi:MAG TPA: YCF48-related protein, partial [Terriglobus sp.]
MRPLLVLSLLAATAHAQFTLQKSNTTASLRGVESVDGQVAWASGTSGTVLRTVDGGANWQTCVVPTGAEKLDFRAVQAFDTQTALVMSVGNGDSSRIYRTDDGCKTWKQVYANPDAPGGFFDALYFTNRNEGWLLGDPVNGSFFLAVTHDGGLSWMRVPVPALEPTEKGGAFAASNQSLLVANSGPVFGGGGGILFR